MTDEREDEEVALLDPEDPDAEQQPDGEDEQSSGVNDGGEDDDEEFVVSFDGEDAADDDTAPDLPKRLRNELKESRKREKELARELETLKAPPKPAEIGPRPSLADHDYDEDAYEAALDAWKASKSEADTAAQEAAKARETANLEWQATMTAYASKKAALARPDMQDAEDAVVGEIDPVRQAIIVSGADDPAKVIYALGRNPAKLAELAAIKDPVRFAFAIAKLEGRIKMTTRRKAPDPEQVTRGSAPLSAKSADKRLEELEREADRTGDRSKLAAYRRQMKETAK